MNTYFLSEAQLKWYPIWVVILVLACVFVAPLGAVTLPVPLIPQRAPSWCWAASSEMVADYLNPSQKSAIGQCSLAREVLTEACGCQPPDQALVSDPDCDRLNPFGSSDFIPILLKKEDVRVIPSSAQQLPSTIARELLMCEVERRRAPVIFWSGAGNCATTAGHIAVAAGFVKTQAKGVFVYVLDPLPRGSNGGDRYWLTWKGFACGPLGFGQCAAYYNLKHESDSQGACMVSSTQEVANCTGTPEEFERIASLDMLSSYLNELKNDPQGEEILKSLDFEKGDKSFECASEFILREALPAAVPGSAFPYRRTGRSRIFCRYDSSSISATVSEVSSGGFYLAAFGGRTTSNVLLSRARGLVESLIPDKLKPSNLGGAPIELEELFLPGAGETILIIPGSPERFSVRLHESDKKSPRPLDSLLNEEINIGTGTTLRQMIDRILAN